MAATGRVKLHAEPAVAPSPPATSLPFPEAMHCPESHWAGLVYDLKLAVRIDPRGTARAIADAIASLEREANRLDDRLQRFPNAHRANVEAQQRRVILLRRRVADLRALQPIVAINGRAMPYEVYVRRARDDHVRSTVRLAGSCLRSRCEARLRHGLRSCLPGELRDHMDFLQRRPTRFATKIEIDAGWTWSEWAHWLERRELGAIWLRDGCDMSWRQIGSLLGVSHASASNHEKAAVATIVARLAQQP